MKNPKSEKFDNTFTFIGKRIETVNDKNGMNLKEDKTERARINEYMEKMKKTNGQVVTGIPTTSKFFTGELDNAELKQKGCRLCFVSGSSGGGTIRTSYTLMMEYFRDNYKNMKGMELWQQMASVFNNNEELNLKANAPYMVVTFGEVRDHMVECDNTEIMKKIQDDSTKLDVIIDKTIPFVFGKNAKTGKDVLNDQKAKTLIQMYTLSMKYKTKMVELQLKTRALELDRYGATSSGAATGIMKGTSRRLLAGDARKIAESSKNRSVKGLYTNTVIK